MPAGLEDKSSVVAVNELGPVHANVYGETPPVTVKLIAPVEAPLRITVQLQLQLQLINQLLFLLHRL